MVTSKRAGEAVLVMAAMADSMMAAVVWEEAGWGRFEGGDMVAMMLVIAVVGSDRAVDCDYGCWVGGRLVWVWVWGGWSVECGAVLWVWSVQECASIRIVDARMNADTVMNTA